MFTFPALLALLGCAGDMPASPEEVSDLRERHVTPLARTGCPGCPHDWVLQPCTFLEVLIKQGSGAEAVTCETVLPRGDNRGLPDQVQLIAQQRVDEAIVAAARRPGDALRLYALGGDLLRLAEPSLWKLGQEAQARALDLLERADIQDDWPRGLLGLAVNGLSPVRIVDMVLVDALSAPLPISYQQLHHLDEASTLALNAVRSSGEERAQWLSQFTEAVPCSLDVAQGWRMGEAQKDRAIQIALNGALRNETAKHEPCPRALQALVPDDLAQIPSGWELRQQGCVAERSQSGN